MGGVYMKEYKVGIIGATGMVGQRLITLLCDHPWFKISVLAASSNSAGKSYRESVDGRWVMKTPLPGTVGDMTVYDAVSDLDTIKKNADFLFCAVNMKKDEIKELEELYAKNELPVISNNSANRLVGDVPMIIPEVNGDHLAVIEEQRKRLGTKKGFIAVKSNCSIQSYVPALTPLLKYGIEDVLVSTYQAISGAGKTFERWPEMVDNIIPYIGGEEEKSEIEPLKVWGSVENGKIVPASEPKISAQCIRVPVTDGHFATVSVRFKNKPSKEEIIKAWNEYSGEPQRLKLPHAPEKFIHYFEEDDRPQIRTERDLEGGMAVSVGRLREDNVLDYKFVSLSHNTLRGAAGGGVLLAELLAAKGYFD